MRIALLCGGESAERTVSLVSGACVKDALCEKGHEVFLIDWRGEEIAGSLGSLLYAADAVFLALHGGAGENGDLSRALEKKGIFHYTGASPQAAALAADKARAKACVEKAGVPVAKSIVLEAGENAGKALLPPFPLAAKPLCGGSSIGLRFFGTKEEIDGLTFDEPMLIESFLAGREYSVAFLCGKVLPPVEIRPKGGVFDYAHKYTAGASEEICPAPLSPEKYRRLTKTALCAIEAIGLRDFARIDFKEDAGGVPRFLEANAIPGMTKTSLLPLAASRAGISFADACEEISRAAAARKSGAEAIRERSNDVSDQRL